MEDIFGTPERCTKCKWWLYPPEEHCDQCSCTDYDEHDEFEPMEEE